MKLFQYAVIWNPSEKEKKEGEKSKLIVDLTTILADNEKTAAILAARAIPPEYTACLDQMEIALRPF